MVYIGRYLCGLIVTIRCHVTMPAQLMVYKTVILSRMEATSFIDVALRHAVRGLRPGAVGGLYELGGFFRRDTRQTQQLN